MKKIDLYTFIYNDEDFLPFFLNYYSFVDRMTFIDSGSTDKTLQILNDFARPENPIIRITQTGLDWWDHDILHQYKNEIWRESQYDLVIFPDCDEIFYHPDIVRFLNRKECNDIYEMQGFEMVSKSFPINGNILSVNTGVPFHMYNKSTIFNPKIDIKFINAHVRCSPCGNVNMGEIKLLHYRSLGVEMMKKRRDREKSRLPDRCPYRHFDSDKEIIARHTKLMSLATKVI